MKPKVKKIELLFDGKGAGFASFRTYTVEFNSEIPKYKRIVREDQQSIHYDTVYLRAQDEVEAFQHAMKILEKVDEQED